MDFKDTIRQLSERISKLKESLLTEEATKNAFIMPFIQSLGYDVFNPTEVVPEMDCDLVKKKGEKIDYAILSEGEAIMLFECKHWQQNLDLHDTQLQKYFVASKAKFGVLTNGIEYRFYTDLEKPNIMDETPFLVVDMENIKDNQIEELKKFHKSYFNIEDILSTANDLKYMSALRGAIKEEFTSPSPDLVKILTKKVYDGIVTQKVLEQFTELVKRSLNAHINDVMAARLNFALKTTEDKPTEETTVEAGADNEVEEVTSDNHNIVTTEEEISSYLIVKAICCQKVDVKRIAYRDAQSYFNVLLDDNNRKPICRMYFNRAQKYIATFDAEKKEEKHPISSLNEIYNFTNEILQAIEMYDNK